MALKKYFMYYLDFILVINFWLAIVVLHRYNICTNPILFNKQFKKFQDRWQE